MLTPEDKALISEYMGWAEIGTEDIMNGKHGTVLVKKDMSYVHFDLNDAALCVEKMVEKGDTMEFQLIIYGKMLLNTICDEVKCNLEWLFNSDNFFQAMAEWLRRKK